MFAKIVKDQEISFQMMEEDMPVLKKINHSDPGHVIW